MEVPEKPSIWYGAADSSIAFKKPK